MNEREQPSPVPTKAGRVIEDRGPEDSVFLRALGSETERLRPEVASYVAGPPAPGLVGIGTGIFEIAGSRYGRWNLLARLVVGPEVLITAQERDVPFEVVNRPARAPGGGPELRAERFFLFSTGTQGFSDVLRATGEPGILRNLLGPKRRLELRLRCGVTESGHLSLRAERSWLRLWRFRIPLPAALTVSVDLEDGYDAVAERQTIRAKVSNPILGTVLEYRGSFTYRYAAD
ncbi:hypothetical protein BMH32_08475 [Leucobacter sp. OLJS4]|uniref:DUF4166 domain-containing protein n=1 Tax=unclassified Leucobacter TaxID=2621730 RepID=UPI000C411272|nr:MULTISPECIES: DUF4166 domain-containing protein [unclassified Leucobacter]PII99234.1 hypothetical protein BMH29_05865 [Leucobacter sp. OLDS2]PIJ01235.1 hypothetical protein BMH31_15095 [Leucobacter sp. OLIS6]PIJ10703.1 hypothetical protein BMH32_08475 [Leucobacter sp. OLJS4]PII95966.1 hypothetical protein BMH26_01230 [Leucobacter sp. OLTLW20]PIJ57540.1 hypothetical protein BV503_01005 [Leucobacter sp. OAMSW11]